MAAAAAAAPPPAPFAWLDAAPTKTLRKAAVALGIGDGIRGHAARFKIVHLAPYATEEDEGARKVQKAE